MNDYRSVKLGTELRVAGICLSVPRYVYRENGICPVREELYSQTFGNCCTIHSRLKPIATLFAVFHVIDELIRQVTIESPERGLLLLRVRDEVRMTLQAYQTLYQVLARALFIARFCILLGADPVMCSP